MYVIENKTPSLSFMPGLYKERGEKAAALQLPWDLPGAHRALYLTDIKTRGIM